MHIVPFEEFLFPSAVLVHKAVTDRGGRIEQAMVIYKDHRRPAVTFTAPTSFDMFRIGRLRIKLPRTLRIPGLHMMHHVAVQLNSLDTKSQPGKLVYTGTCDGHDITVTLPVVFTL